MWTIISMYGRLDNDVHDNLNVRVTRHDLDDNFNVRVTRQDEHDNLNVRETIQRCAR